ncbi:site-specific DNA-methyltransferase, partial [Corynebacterium sanguinis]|uniref:site-specific DNA-methyltransferase n=3 Tax=Corynebacterium sanguinis TaxID=2594913 RepID=UPI0021A5A864
NLEVLKILQKHYHGKIKMIYIDPPYNTGKDFVYPDNFKEGLDTYLQWSKQVNEEGKKLSSNSESEGRYHSNWLNMMYPRLKLARNLLSLDGFIFISIDDHEQDSLKKVCNEVFGEANFVATVVVFSNPRGRQSTTHIAASHEYVHVYARNVVNASLSGEPLTPDQISEFNKVDSNGVAYREIGLRLRGGRATAAESPTLHYPIYVDPKTSEIFVEANADDSLVEVLPYFSNGEAGTWRWSAQKVAADVDQLTARMVRTSEGQRWDIFQKDYLSEKSRRKPKSLWSEKGVNYDRSKDDLRTLGMDKLFSYAKPVSLLKKIISLTTSPNSQDIILDFFSGSSTTAQAVMQLNAEDGGDRSHIQIQLPEPTHEKSEAYKSGFNNIAEISRERIRRAGDTILRDSAEKPAHRPRPLDVGFRTFKLADTNFAKWRAESDTDATKLEQHLLALRESADDNATPDDLLTEILIKQGHSLVEQIRDRKIDGLSFKAVVEVDDEADKEDTLVLAYLDEHTKPTLAQLRAAVDVKPAQFIILEDAFKGDDELKSNLAQICKTNGIELWTA